ncbi:MAG: VWA-like domain-containing protein [Paracoccaceae bacterium]
MVLRSERAARAIQFLPDQDPALAALALWCDIHDSDGPTRTVGQRILISKTFTTLPLRDQIGVLGHHILHVALRHSARLEAMQARFGSHFAADTYNLATDALVNEVLEQSGHALPRPAVTLSGLLQEVLREDTTDALARWDTDRLFITLQAQDGAGQKRQVVYAQQTAFKPDLGRETAEPANESTSTWQGHITRAVQTPGAAGRGIGTVLAQILDLPRVDTPWEHHLRRLLAKAVAQHPRPTFRRPRPGWIAAEAQARHTKRPTPVFEPGLARDQVRPRIVVGIDSSGSVSDTILKLFLAELAAIARRSGAETHLLCFDDMVYDQRLVPADAWETALKTLHFRREGGTSFIDVLDRARRLSPSIAVILTDLDGPFGPPPDFGVIWATPLSTWTPPAFGSVLSMAR